LEASFGIKVIAGEGRFASVFFLVWRMDWREL